MKIIHRKNNNQKLTNRTEIIYKILIIVRKNKFKKIYQFWQKNKNKL